MSKRALLHGKYVVITYKGKRYTFTQIESTKGLSVSTFLKQNNLRLSSAPSIRKLIRASIDSGRPVKVLDKGPRSKQKKQVQYTLKIRDLTPKYPIIPPAQAFEGYDLSRIGPVKIRKYKTFIGEERTTKIDVHDQDMVRFGYDTVFKQLVDMLPIFPVPEGYSRTYAIGFNFLLKEDFDPKIDFLTRDTGFAYTKSTNFVPTREELWYALHRLYEDLIARYDQEVILVSIDIKLKTILTKSDLLPINGAKLDQFRRWIRVMKYNQSYSGQYDKFLRIKGNNRLYCPSTYSLCFAKCWVLLNHRFRIKDKSTLQNMAEKFKKDLVGKTKESFLLGQYMQKVRDMAKKYQENHATTLHWKKHPPNLRVYSLISGPEYYDLGSDRTIEMLLIGTHCCAILPKENQDIWSDFADDKYASKRIFTGKNFRECYLLANETEKYFNRLQLSERAENFYSNVKNLKEFYEEIDKPNNTYYPKNSFEIIRGDNSKLFDFKSEKIIKILRNKSGKYTLPLPVLKDYWSYWDTELCYKQAICKLIEKPGYRIDYIAGHKLRIKKPSVRKSSFMLPCAEDGSYQSKPFSGLTVAWDAETETDNDNKLFLISAYNGEEIFTTKCCSERPPSEASCIIKFINYVKNYALKYPEGTHITFYSHNGGKFDNHFVYDYVLNTRGCSCTIPDNPFIKDGRLINFSTVFKKRKLSFRDSYTILLGSLANLTGPGGFNVEHQKLVGEVDMKLFRQDIIQTRPDICKKMIKYCNYDAMGLFEVLKEFHGIILNTFGIDFRDKYTAASISKKIFMERYYDPDNFPLYNLSDKIDEFIRESYFGGRTDLYNKIGEQNPGFYYYIDAVSWYPTQMSQKKLPYGLPRHILGDRSIRNIISTRRISGKDPWKSVEGFVRCKVRSLRNIKIPIHGVKRPILNGKPVADQNSKRTKKLIFPNFKNWTEITLYTPEIRAGMSRDKSGNRLVYNPIYEYKFIEGYFFRTSHFYKLCTDDVFQLKKNSKGQPAKKKTMKIILNSLYGWWCINRYAKNYKITRKIDHLYSTLATGTLSNVTKFPGRQLFAIEYDDFMTNVISNVGIGAAITALARLGLWKFMMEIEDPEYRDILIHDDYDPDNENFGKVFYSDTDSIICSLDVQEEPYFKIKYFSNPGNLGDWSNEIEEKTSAIQSYWDKHPEKRQTRVKGFWSKPKLTRPKVHKYSKYLVTLGPKVYAIKKFVKLKGYAVLNGHLKIDHEKKKIYVNPNAEIPDEELITSCLKEKSIKKSKATLNKEIFKLVAQNYKIVQKNAYIFKGSVSAQIFGGLYGTETTIPVEKIDEKIFQMNYDKQKVDENNNLTPHII